MTQFHEGQEVEVCKSPRSPGARKWAKAKIVGLAADQSQPSSDLRYVVEFASGTRGVFDTDYIRTIGLRVGWDEVGSMVISE